MSYSRTGGSKATPSDNTVTTSSSGISSTNSNTNTNSNTSQSQSGQSSTTTSINQLTEYLDPASKKALQNLLASLQGQRGQSAQAVNSEVATNQQLRGDYSKEAAFGDAQGAMLSQLSKALQDQLPTIAAGIDSAGTSGSAMSALLTQKAAEDSAARAAELGLQASISYGQIQAGFSDVISKLLTTGDSVTNQLISALDVAKGSTQKTTGTTTEKSKSSSIANSSTSQNSSTSSTTAENKTGVATTNYANNGNKGSKPSGSSNGAYTFG